jgi:hypothetical protein
LLLVCAVNFLYGPRRGDGRHMSTSVQHFHLRSEGLKVLSQELNREARATANEDFNKFTKILKTIICSLENSLIFNDTIEHQIE